MSRHKAIPTDEMYPCKLKTTKRARLRFLLAIKLKISIGVIQKKLFVRD